MVKTDFETSGLGGTTVKMCREVAGDLHDVLVVECTCEIRVNKDILALKSVRSEWISFIHPVRTRAGPQRARGKTGAGTQLRQARSRGNLRSWLPTQHHLAQLHARIRCDSRGKKQPTLHPKTTKDDLVSAIHAVSMSKLSAPTVPGVNAQRTRQDPNISSMILSTTCECHVLSVSG